MGMGAAEAVERFSLLTIGDGLVTQIPALLLSVSSGIIVTRSTADGDLGNAASAQLTPVAPGAADRRRRAPSRWRSCPGMPKMPFVLVGARSCWSPRSAARRATSPRTPRRPPRSTAPGAAPATPTPPRRSSSRCACTPSRSCSRPTSSTSSAAATATCCPASAGCAARSRSTSASSCRRSAPATPSTCRAATYAVRISGVEVGRGELPVGRVLALGDALDALPGPGRARAGVRPRRQVGARRAAARRRDVRRDRRRPGVGAHHAPRLDHRQARLPPAHPRGRPGAHRGRQGGQPVRRRRARSPVCSASARCSACCTGLLDEQVPIRDLGRIYEALSLRAKDSTHVGGLVEAARGGARSRRSRRRTASTASCACSSSTRCSSSSSSSRCGPADGGMQMHDGPGPGRQRARLGAPVRRQRPRASASPRCSRAPPRSGAPLRSLVLLATPDLPVLSYNEVTESGLRIETVGTVRDAHAVAA